MTLHRQFDGGAGDTLVRVDPGDAGWTWTGLQVLALQPGRPRTVATGATEVFVLPLTCGALSVDVEGHGPLSLQGRSSVFTQTTDFCYVGRDSVVQLCSETGGEVALPSALCSAVLPPAYGTAPDREVRGAGSATRLVTSFGVPGAWDHADKLICCELVTPPGNWSSYPPHKHDATSPCTVVNEEIYYYRVAGQDQVTASRQGVAYHRTYTGPEHLEAGLAPIDELAEVRDQDVVLVPYGYHGPSIAAPGYPLYYLNVMAGPADERALAFCDDPDHAWVRDGWVGTAPDPRCVP
jgi:5-deoxy-glucuronate isomerase